MFVLFLKGLLIGFAIAAPVGPIGVLCIQRSLQEGFKIGLMTGLGAALADGSYGLVAGLGLTAVSSLLIKHQYWIRLLGSLFLIYLGIKIMLTPAKPSLPTGKTDKSPWHACATSYLLTLANPATILSFLAVFAGLGLGTEDPELSQAFVLVCGIIFGSACWWFFLSAGVALILHRRINTGMMKAINIISGILILALGVLAFKI